LPCPRSVPREKSKGQGKPSPYETPLLAATPRCAAGLSPKGATYHSPGQRPGITMRPVSKPCKGEIPNPRSRRTVTKIYRSERKGRRRFDTAIAYGTVALAATEMT